MSRSEVVDVRYQQISPLTMAMSEVSKAAEQLRLLAKGRPGESPE
jgi:hypothetical protein